MQRRTRGRVVRHALAASWFALIAAHGAASAQSGSPELQSEIRSAFQQLFLDPGNPELTYGYGQLQVRAGNYEAAVAALERLLLLNPNQPRLKYELGVLYFRMGSYQMARVYLMQADADPNVPPEIRERIRSFMAEADRRTSRHQFTGSITLGARMQSNANLAANARQVQASGVTINSPNRPRSDFSGILIGRVTHVYDFQTNDGAAWVTNGLFYGTRHVKVSSTNVTLGELYTGPRFNVFPNLRPGATIRPYFINNIVGLDDAHYSHTFGGGADLSIPFGSRWAVELTYQYRDINYRNTASQPTASQLTGHENIARGRVVYQVDARSAVLAELSGRFARTQASQFDFDEVGVTATYTMDYNAWGARPWNVTGSVGYFHRNYDAPDPVVNPSVSRRENEWRLGVANVIPVADNWFLVQQFDALIIGSNLPNYERRDYAGTLAVRWRF